MSKVLSLQKRHPRFAEWEMPVRRFFWRTVLTIRQKYVLQTESTMILKLRNEILLHQNKFSACKSADDCKQFFCAFCGCFARIYRNLCRKQRISKLDFRQCVLNKKPRFSLFLSHASPDNWKIYKALESKNLQKHTPKYLKSLFLKIENIKVLWKTASENNLKKYDFELNP